MAVPSTRPQYTLHDTEPVPDFFNEVVFLLALFASIPFLTYSPTQKDMNTESSTSSPAQQAHPSTPLRITVKKEVRDEKTSSSSPSCISSLDQFSHTSPCSPPDGVECQSIYTLKELASETDTVSDSGSGSPTSPWGKSVDRTGLSSSWLVFTDKKKEVLSPGDLTPRKENSGIGEDKEEGEAKKEREEREEKEVVLYEGLEPQEVEEVQNEIKAESENAETPETTSDDGSSISSTTLSSDFTHLSPVPEPAELPLPFSSCASSSAATAATTTTTITSSSPAPPRRRRCCCCLITAMERLVFVLICAWNVLVLSSVPLLGSHHFWLRFWRIAVVCVVPFMVFRLWFVLKGICEKTSSGVEKVKGEEEDQERKRLGKHEAVKEEVVEAAS